jgi:hypothetical protein
MNLQMVAFALITMSYHVMLDQTWNPFRWTRRINQELENPDPVSVARRPRAGKLKLPEEKEILSIQNAKALGGFIWSWMR